VYASAPATHACSSTFLDLRVEWSRARARHDRWMEEVALVSEEMRRNLPCCVYEHK
jgi:hypothetical protein